MNMAPDLLTPSNNPIVYDSLTKLIERLAVNRTLACAAFRNKTLIAADYFAGRDPVLDAVFQVITSGSAPRS